MAKNSSIEWTHHTFNPWWGCAKVSPACTNCYAETWAKRTGNSVWGKQSERRFFSDKHWAEPLKWEAVAANRGARERVFCASMSDVFERRADLKVHRERLWDLILRTPHLDWLLLTKRPQNIGAMVPWDKEWPRNVWIGTTVENQKYAEERLPHLLKHPATVRFLSCEPLLGKLDLRNWMCVEGMYPISWVIAGGESGAKSRPMHPAWVTSLKDQCEEFNVPFHFKQWGHWVPAEIYGPEKKPETFKVAGEDPIEMVAAGKKGAGRTLEGLHWDGVPSFD